jgi:hypothetical protein
MLARRGRVMASFAVDSDHGRDVASEAIQQRSVITFMVTSPPMWLVLARLMRSEWRPERTTGLAGLSLPLALRGSRPVGRVIVWFAAECWPAGGM